MNGTRIERLKTEIEVVEKAFRIHEKAYKRARESGVELAYAKEQYDYFEGVVEGLATALKIIEGGIK